MHRIENSKYQFCYYKFGHNKELREGETIVNKENIQGRLELITRKWWFFLIFVLIQFFIPPYASKGFEWSEVGMVTGEVLSNALVYDYPIVYPIFKIIPIVLVLSLIFLKNKANRFFSVYVAISYVLFAFLQSIAVTEKFGLGIITLNLAMFIFVAAFWFWEASIQKNDFTPQKQSMWKYWVIPAAFIAFWYPCSISSAGAVQDFNLIHLLTNEAGLTFCMMTPVYLAILTLYHPNVNMATLRVTSLVGVIIGIYNVLVNFILATSLWWNGILHIPLLAVSAYALALSFIKRNL